MEESKLMMALLIPGSASPRKDFDLFLKPLVEDYLSFGPVCVLMMVLVTKCLIFVLQFCSASMITQL
jgi:hypothetical protein